MGYLVSILGTHTPVGEGGQIYWVSIPVGKIVHGATLFRFWARPPPSAGEGRFIGFPYI